MGEIKRDPDTHSSHSWQIPPFLITFTRARAPQAPARTRIRYGCTYADCVRVLAFMVYHWRYGKN